MCLYIYLICMYVCISINYFSINGPVGIDIHILIYIYTSLRIVVWSLDMAAARRREEGHGG